MMPQQERALAVAREAGARHTNPLIALKAVLVPARRPDHPGGEVI